MVENGYSYRLATPEKALCDELYTLSPCANRVELEQLLFEDLRIDKTEFKKLHANGILQIGDRYHSNNLKYLMKYLRRNKK